MDSERSPIIVLLETAQALEDWLAAADVGHALIGGFAVSFRGQARATDDIDAVVQVPWDRLVAFVEIGKAHGFEFREPGSLEFTRRNKVMTLRHVPTGVPVDLSVAGTPFEDEAISRADVFTVRGVSFPILASTDLLIMKALARRDHDLGDIEGILNRHPDLDLRPVRVWLDDVGTAMDDPTYLSEFDALVARWRRRRQRRSEAGPGST